MKSSDLEKAAKLISSRKFYHSMLDMLNDYPGFDAILDVNGKRLMISRTQATAVLDAYMAQNDEESAAISLVHEY